MKTNKKNILPIIVMCLSVLILLFGLTYAYFSSNFDLNNKDVTIKAKTATQANVEYSLGNDLLLTNAEPGDSANSINSITLTASNSNTEVFTYNINWLVTANNFVQVLGHESDPVLTYQLFYSYDNNTWILANQGSCPLMSTSTIASNQILNTAANTTKTVYWKMVVTYESYDYDQSVNMSKTFAGHIEFVEQN